MIRISVVLFAAVLAARRGLYSVARLIATYDAELPLPTLFGKLPAERPGRQEATPRCGIAYADPIGG